MSNTITVDMNKVPAGALNALCRGLSKNISKFFENPDNQRAFEEWHTLTYGRPPQEASYMNTQDNKNVSDSDTD